MSEHVRLIVTQRTFRPGREFAAGEIIVEGATSGDVTLAQVNRLMALGRIRAMNYTPTVSEPPPGEHQESPPVSHRAPPPRKKAAGKKAARKKAAGKKRA